MEVMELTTERITMRECQTELSISSKILSSSRTTSPSPSPSFNYPHYIPLFPVIPFETFNYCYGFLGHDLNYTPYSHIRTENNTLFTFGIYIDDYTPFYQSVIRRFFFKFLIIIFIIFFNNSANYLIYLNSLIIKNNNKKIV